jgi:hypothetical protein
MSRSKNKVRQGVRLRLEVILPRYIEARLSRIAEAEGSSMSAVCSRLLKSAAAERGDIVSGHGKTVAECEEFTLYADGWIESSPDVELALKRSRFATSSRGGAEGAESRLALKMALWDLMEMTAGQFVGSDADLLEDLIATLGQSLLDALNEAESAAKRTKGAVKKTSSAVADVESAMTQMVRYRSKLPMPNDTSHGAWTWIIQHTAKTIFRHTKKRPTKFDVRCELEAEGWGFKKSNDPEENWKRVFRAAGLGSLPS